MHPERPLPDAFLKTPQRLRRVQVEITTWCNLQCPGCPRTIGRSRGQWRDQHLSFAHFQSLIDALPPSYILVLQGIGEPVLHPSLRDFISYAHETDKFTFITFNTNALAQSMEYFVDLKKAGLNHLSISVDSFNQFVVEMCRYGTLTRRLRARIQSIAEALDFPITLSMVLSRNNLYDFPQTCHELDQMGSFVLEIQPLMVYQGKIPDNTDHLLNDEDIIFFRKMYSLILPRLKRLSLLTAGPLWPSGLKGCCLRPFTAPYITVEGFLTPCCTVIDPAVLDHTCLFEKSFDDAWQAPAVQTWLRAYLNEQPMLCQSCAFNTEASLSS